MTLLVWIINTPENKTICPVLWRLLYGGGFNVPYRNHSLYIQGSYVQEPSHLLEQMPNYVFMHRQSSMMTSFTVYSCYVPRHPTSSSFKGEKKGGNLSVRIDHVYYSNSCLYGIALLSWGSPLDRPSFPVSKGSYNIQRAYFHTINIKKWHTANNNWRRINVLSMQHNIQEIIHGFKNNVVIKSNWYMKFVIASSVSEQNEWQN